MIDDRKERRIDLEKDVLIYSQQTSADYMLKIIYTTTTGNNAQIERLYLSTYLQSQSPISDDALFRISLSNSSRCYKVSTVPKNKRYFLCNYPSNRAHYFDVDRLRSRKEELGVQINRMG